ncbi:putative Replication factor C subunit 1 [Sclerotinia borealis F-4128]|uniref:Replication factor C subunit 1 n=1 Tax=Sclerotinia borealis (strain F-4128) TaxID=1432307 RepID=W9CIT6_SCLBF|nr:putative Replication factor C subunit 1 [Sclerotinia borealis F-4128]
MPADIRSFFGGKPGASTSTPIRGKGNKKEEDSKKKKSKSRKIIEDSDDDEEPLPIKPEPKKAAAKKSVKNEELEGKETTADDFFASSNKPKAKPAKSTPIKAIQPPPARSSTRKKTSSGRIEIKDDDDFDEDDDIFAADVKKTGKRKDDGYVEDDSDDEVLPKPKRIVSKSKTAPIKKDKDVEMKDVGDDDVLVVPDDDEGNDMMIIEKPSKNSVVNGKKRKSVNLESDDDEEVVPAKKSPKSKSSKPPPAKKPRAPPKKKAAAPESSNIQAILDSIPTVRAPTPPPKDVKYDWRAGGGGNSGPPPAAGCAEIPEGAENCLAGFTFVFTGVLNTISRDEGMELVKRCGGKITGAPSGKTSYVVLGTDAGPSKLRKIQDLKIKTIDEEGLFAIIRAMPANGGDGKAAEKNNEKKAVEERKIREAAEEMDREERRKVAEAEKAERDAQKLAASKGKSSLPPAPRKVAVPTSSQLWTTKYAPTQMNQICGNKSQVEKIQSWLKGWANAHKYNFQKRGADGLGGYRAIIIHGPPGIGKTTAAHLAAKLAGYDILERNASDVRSKKLVETGLSEVLNNTSVLGYFAGDGKDIDKTKKKLVLIMDEVDGMSSGDRGGVGALAKICKTTDIPMILICNDRKLPKMKPFDFVTFDMPFKRPTVDMVRSRIATICHREGMKLPVQVIDALIEGSNKDIRQIINMISTVKLDQIAIDFDQGKEMSKAWEKHVVLKPWDITSQLLGGHMFAPTSKSTLNDKIELYFNDHEFTPLMIQENYLNTKPQLANTADTPREHKLKVLQLVDQAAESISDGDLVDRMIHGSQQQWSLMPTHAVFSTVRPSSFISGSITGRTNFTSWLGNNSRYGKLSRYVKEIQSHMRLRSSGDRHEIRQQYLPVLWDKLIRRLDVEGRDSVEDVIDLMDSYFLTREDWDYIMELGVGEQDMESVKLETQTKANFTRSYNARSHPVPFMKASNVFQPAKVAAAKPDLEEAFEEEDDGEVIAEPVDDDEIDLKKDKYIKQPKVKKVAKKPVKKKTKSTMEDDSMIDDEEEEEEEKKPKKAKEASASTSTSVSAKKGKK